MSYDYLFFNLSGNESPTIKALEFAVGMGTVEEVKAQISKVFPAVIWEESTTMPGFSFGRQGPPKFQVSAEENGQVQNFMASRIEISEVKSLVQHMSLVALDLQSQKFLS